MSASDAVRAFEQAFNDNDAEAMRSAAADGYVDRWPMPDVGADIDGAIAFRAMIATAFPDMEQTLDEVIDQGGTAASRWPRRRDPQGRVLRRPGERQEGRDERHVLLQGAGRQGRRDLEPPGHRRAHGADRRLTRLK